MGLCQQGHHHPSHYNLSLVGMGERVEGEGAVGAFLMNTIVHQAVVARQIPTGIAGINHPLHHPHKCLHLALDQLLFRPPLLSQHLQHPRKHLLPLSALYQACQCQLLPELMLPPHAPVMEDQRIDNQTSGQSLIIQLRS